MNRQPCCDQPMYHEDYILHGTANGLDYIFSGRSRQFCSNLKMNNLLANQVRSMHPLKLQYDIKCMFIDV